MSHDHSYSRATTYLAAIYPPAGLFGGRQLGRREMMPEGDMSLRLISKAKASGVRLDSERFAEILDKEDPLRNLRDNFHIPQRDDKDCIYLLGNSLGLQPKAAKELLGQELDVWARRANEGHFNHDYGRPWLTVDEECVDLLLPLVGAQDGEVAVMGSLTANLHLLMCAFYHPDKQRYKILLESRAFPSDYVQKKLAQELAAT